MDNVQMSEVLISKILRLLMDLGIQEQRLEFRELGLDESFAPFFIPCVRWLVDEGVIRTGEIIEALNGPVDSFVLSPVLTSYGMRIMQAEANLPGLDDKKVSEIVDEVKSGNAHYAKAGNFTGGLLASFIKSFG